MKQRRNLKKRECNLKLILEISMKINAINIPDIIQSNPKKLENINNSWSFFFYTLDGRSYWIYRIQIFIDIADDNDDLKVSAFITASTERLRVTERAKRANLLKPFCASSSIGCFNAVISRNVSKNNTTTSFSFLIGATCNNSHNGVPINILQEWRQ
ncbi:hypothetical protein DERP_003009 [Dermatophagoides pteronyssinus]|uniref:Uncharacterized protein n=1 Tax=Dermatophagoides pteronyssinus TaxID=6956 RepID=A0ABQ8JWK7_DERPT|nr:hypothetical protein DERP_003009 [Dermatophagoides pteronyssinus]